MGALYLESFQSLVLGLFLLIIVWYLAKSQQNADEDQKIIEDFYSSYTLDDVEDPRGSIIQNKGNEELLPVFK